MAVTAPLSRRSFRRRRTARARGSRSLRPTESLAPAQHREDGDSAQAYPHGAIGSWEDMGANTAVYKKTSRFSQSLLRKGTKSPQSATNRGKIKVGRPKSRKVLELEASVKGRKVLSGLRI